MRRCGCTVGQEVFMTQSVLLCIMTVCFLPIAINTAKPQLLCLCSILLWVPYFGVMYWTLLQHSFF